MIRIVVVNAAVAVFCKSSTAIAVIVITRSAVKDAVTDADRPLKETPLIAFANE